MTGLLVVAITGWCSSAALALVLARLRAQALDRAEHLARVAHELRGPLHAAGLVLVSARRATPPGDACDRALSALEVEIGRAALATRDLSHATERARRSPRTPAACDVAVLTRELAAGWEVLAQTTDRALDVRVPPGPLWACGARLRVAQALGNLVGNALEHGSGPVTVSVTRAPGGGAQIEVCDAGPGLPAPVSTLVERPPDPTRTRGRGLGIAAEVATSAGGRLASAPSARGARLVLQLPQAPPPARPVAAPAGGHPTRPLAS